MGFIISVRQKEITGPHMPLCCATYIGLVNLYKLENDTYLHEVGKFIPGLTVWCRSLNPEKKGVEPNFVPFENSSTNVGQG